MSLSINTNVGALTALSVLNQTNKALETTQARISSGFRVGTAKDDAASYSIASKMRADVAGFEAVKIGLGIGEATVGTAIKAAEAIKELLVEMKAKAVQAQGGGLTDDDRHALNDDVNKLQDQIDNIVRTAEFNDKNLIKSEGDAMSVVADVSGTSQIEITAIALDQVSLGLRLETQAYEDDKDGDGEADKRVIGDFTDKDVTNTAKYAYDDATGLTVSGDDAQSAGQAVAALAKAAQTKATESLTAANRLLDATSAGFAATLETAMLSAETEAEKVWKNSTSGSAYTANETTKLAVVQVKAWIGTVSGGTLTGGKDATSKATIDVAVSATSVAKLDADTAFTKAEEMVSAAKTVWDQAKVAAISAAEAATAVEATGGDSTHADNAKTEADEAAANAEKIYDAAVTAKIASETTKTAAGKAYDDIIALRNVIHKSGVTHAQVVEGYNLFSAGVSTAVNAYDDAAATTGLASKAFFDAADDSTEAINVDTYQTNKSTVSRTLENLVKNFTGTVTETDNEIGSAKHLQADAASASSTADSSVTTADTLVDKLSASAEAAAAAETSATASNTAAATAKTSMEAAQTAAVAAYDALKDESGATTVDAFAAETTAAIEAAVDSVATALSSATDAEVKALAAKTDAEAAKVAAQAAYEAAENTTAKAQAEAALESAKAAAEEADKAHTKAGLAKADVTALQTAVGNTKDVSTNATDALTKATTARTAAFTASGNVDDTATAALNTSTLVASAKKLADTASIGNVSSGESSDDTPVIQRADRITMIDVTTGDKTAVNDVKRSQELIDEAIDTVTAALAYYGSVSKQLEVQKDFTQGLIDQLNIGIGTLVDADMAKESAMLQSLQIKQNLGTQALGIANAAPQTILGLFG